MTGPFDVRVLADALDPLTVELVPSAPPAEVLDGDPTAAELVFADSPDVEIGVWEVTAGVFRSRKVGVVEVMHFVTGAGRIDHDAGGSTEIRPGAVVVVGPEWSGTWHVTAAARKVYTIFSPRPSDDAAGPTDEAAVHQ